MTTFFSTNILKKLQTLFFFLKIVGYFLILLNLKEDSNLLQLTYLKIKGGHQTVDDEPLENLVVCGADVFLASEHRV